MKAVCLLLTWLLLYPSSAFAELDERELRITTGDSQRRAILVKNKSTQDKTLVPAIIVLHGGAGSAERVRRTTGFDSLAVTENVLIAYAEGTSYRKNSHAWNTGYILRGKVGNVDDIKYLDVLIDSLIEDHGADPRRIYMTGISNGAMMTFVYAVQRSERLAAIAPVVGAMFSHKEKPRFTIPILMVNGALDDEVPIEGGMSKNPLVEIAQQAPYLSLDSTIKYWVGVNMSEETPDVKRAESVTSSTYPPKAGGTVTVSIVDGMGGHGWPGSVSRRWGNEPISKLDARNLIWNFFKDKWRL